MKQLVVKSITWGTIVFIGMLGMFTIFSKVMDSRNPKISADKLGFHDDSASMIVLRQKYAEKKAADTMPVPVIEQVCRVVKRGVRSFVNAVSNALGTTFDADAWIAKYRQDLFIPKVEQWKPLVLEVCREENVDYRLMTGREILAVINLESGGKPTIEPKVYKPTNGIGLMGVARATASDQGVNPNLLKTPRPNLQAGIRYLNHLVKQYNDVPAALIAYSCGEKKYKDNYIDAGVDPKNCEYYLKVAKLMSLAEAGLADAE